MCSLQEVGWRGEGARMLGMKERYKRWWSGGREKEMELVMWELW